MLESNRFERMIESRLWASHAQARQYRRSLIARISRLELAYPADQHPAVLAAARKTLEDAGADGNLEIDFQLEQMLVAAYDTCTVDVEIQRSLALADQLLGPGLRDWYRRFHWHGKDLETRRAFLGSLTGDLQAALTSQEMVRLCRADLAARMSRRFILSSLFFGLLLVGVLTFHTQLVSEQLQHDIAVRHMIIVASSFFAGLWGAQFSMMTGIRGRLDDGNLADLKLQYRWLPARTLAGAGSGLLIYLLFASKMITGDLFPDLEGYSALSHPSFENGLQLYGKLMLWAVIAGFSERLIPDVLTRIETDMEPDKAAGAARSRRGGSAPDAGKSPGGTANSAPDHGGESMRPDGS